MSFQPFGYRFDVRSPSHPSEVKAAIGSRMSEWFDPKKGARGWIAGPFICLWFSAMDRYGPMLFGRISRDNLGTRISGRAGSDLNGLALFAVLVPLMALLLVQMVSVGDYTFNQVAIIGGIILLSPWVFWMSHKDRRDAEPLVRFLRDTVTVPGQSLRAKSATIAFSKALTLDVGGENLEGAVTPDAIHDALLNVGSGDLVILASDAETYIQTASRDCGYILEMREGDHQHHFKAERRGAVPASVAGSSSVFTFEEVLAAFLAYGSEAAMPSFLIWEPMQLPQ